MDVVFDGVRAERGGRVVLDIPSLRIRGDVTTAILGANGSGKTTLLRLMAALDRPRAGSITVGGAPARLGQRVAFVFQEQVFLAGSVRDNLALGLRLRGVDRASIRSRVEDAAHVLGITHLLERRANHLSGGEARRASIARALCLRAPLVLLDEPLEGLDGSTYARLLDDLPRLLAAFEATTVLVTHSAEEALRLARDLIVLADGRVRAHGDKREVATNPRDAVVAEALGYAVLTSAGRQLAVPAGGLELGPGSPGFSLAVEQTVDLIETTDVVGRIDGVRVRVSRAPGDAVPRPGDLVPVHARRFFELARSA